MALMPWTLTHCSASCSVLFKRATGAWSEAEEHRRCIRRMGEGTDRVRTGHIIGSTHVGSGGRSFVPLSRAVSCDRVLRPKDPLPQRSWC